MTVGLTPEQHGPQPAKKKIWVDENRLLRGTVVLTENGVSQRGISARLGELLDTNMSPSWVNAELAKAEERLARFHQAQSWGEAGSIRTLPGRRVGAPTSRACTACTQ